MRLFSQYDDHERNYKPNGSANDSRMSMREKSRRKKEINKQHESNYKAGAVEVNERQLHRAGIRGRKICLLLFVLIFLFLLCLLNMLILVFQYVNLSINYEGMESMSFFLEDGKLKFLQESDLAYVRPMDGTLGGYLNENLLFEGDKQIVQFLGGSSLNSSSIRVGPDGTDIQTKKGFTLSDPSTAEKILHLDKNTNLKAKGEFSGSQFKTNGLIAPRVVSDDNQDLTFTGVNISLTGNEGLYMDGKTVDFTSYKNLVLNITDQKYTLNIEGLKGVKLERSKLKDTSSVQVSVNGVRYKLCACVNSGKLFRIKVDSTSVSCAHFKTNPCT